MSYGRKLHRESTVAMAALAVAGFAFIGAGNSAAWQNHEGQAVTDVSLSNAGQLKFTLNNPTVENIRCTVHFFTWDSEPYVRATVDRYNELAKVEIATDDPDYFDHVLELHQAYQAIYPDDGIVVDTYFGVPVPGQGSRQYGSLDSPIQDRYVGYSYCDTFSTSPVQDADISLITVTKDSSPGAGGGAFGSLENLLP